MSRAKELERAMAKAFALAERSRGAAGMKPRQPQIIKTREGRRVGPRTYRITLWLKPGEYVDLFEQMREERFNGSVRAFIAARAAGYRLKRKPALRAVG